MKCRDQCGACCIAPSIELPMPNMPCGKAAGVVCVNLDSNNFSCKIWGHSDYPAHCGNFMPGSDVCGESREGAMLLIEAMELATKPL